MPQLSGNAQIFHASTSDRDASQAFVLGSRATEPNGNEWVYLRGTTSIALGGWVLVGSGFVTSSAVADDQGILAIAGTAHVDASTFGWFQVYGHNSAALIGDAVATNSPLWLTLGQGAVTDTDVAADAISGARSLAASVGSACLVQISYPFVHDTALD
jgi:hypothetical protein